MKTRKTKSWMEQETKLMYIMEHINAIEDLLKDNIDGAVLGASERHQNDFRETTTGL